MALVATCTFREPAKSYYLQPGELFLHVGSRVVAETSRGVELGKVRYLPREVPDEKLPSPLKAILRLATAEDLARQAENEQMEEQALVIVRERLAHFGLPMKPIKTEIMLDRARMFFFYESEERVDFRDLLRDLATRLGMRMQFQQLGAREAAKLLDGLGPCGRPLCCSTFLRSTPPVTLKLAKEQGLSLTPNKISGACGRLMCCLRYEIEFYRDQNARLPRHGDPVDTPEGPGHVSEVNVFTEKCNIRLGDGRVISVPGETLRSLRAERGPVRECKNHVRSGGSCHGSEGGGCSSGGCGKDGGCGCSSKPAPALALAVA